MAQNISGVHLWLLLMKTHQSLWRRTARNLEENGLGESDFRVLEVLLHKGSLPVNVIGPKVFLTPGSISVAVDRLRAKGLVDRTESEEDRRIRLVALTPAGRMLISRVFERHEQQMENLASVLTAAERTQLAKILKKLGKNAADAPEAP